MALDTSAVCILAFESICSMARHMPKLQSEILRLMGRRIGELESIAADLNADQRMAIFLLSLAKGFASRGYSGREFRLVMSRRDLASHLRLATETVSRVLARLQKAGLLLVGRQQVTILDFKKLTDLAGHRCQDRQPAPVRPNEENKTKKSIFRVSEVVTPSVKTQVA